MSAERVPPPEVARYRIHTVARMTGLGETVLRAWERRHGLVRPERSESGYREYSGDDLRVLMRAREMLDRGLSIGEVARIGRERLLSARGVEELLPAAAAAATPGGPAAELVAALMRAVSRGDVPAAEEVVARALHRTALSDALREFVSPALVAAGDAWERGEFSPAQERLTTQTLKVPLEGLLASANLGLGPVQVICAPAPGDTHEMGSLMVALECARAGRRALHLAGPLGANDLGALATLVRPRAVCLSFVHAAPARGVREAVRAVRAKLPHGVVLVVGGRGVAPHADEARRAGAEAADGVEGVLAAVGRA